MRREEKIMSMAIDNGVVLDHMLEVFNSGLVGRRLICHLLYVPDQESRSCSLGLRRQEEIQGAIIALDSGL